VIGRSRNPLKRIEDINKRQQRNLKKQRNLHSSSQQAPGGGSRSRLLLCVGPFTKMSEVLALRDIKNEFTGRLGSLVTSLETRGLQGAAWHSDETRETLTNLV